MAYNLHRRTSRQGYSMGRQNTGRRKWGGGVNRQHYSGGGAGGANPFGADGTRGGAANGQPTLLSKSEAMNRALSDSQKHIDSANAGAKAEAAAMGLDYTPDQANLIAGAGAKAGASQQAGFRVDQQNVDTQNQFAMADKQNAHSLEMQSNSISAQQNDPLAWARFNENNSRYKDSQDADYGAAQGELSSAGNTDSLIARERRASGRKARRAAAAKSRAAAEYSANYADRASSRGRRRNQAFIARRKNRRVDNALSKFFSPIDKKDSSMWG